MYNYKLGIVGAGNMSRAIVSKVAESGIIDKSKIAVSDPFTDIGIDGIINLKDNVKLSSECEYILFAVKPQVFREIMNDFNETKALAVISIMAGIKSDFIMNVVPKSCTVIRVMPNTPCMIGGGMVCVAENENKSALQFTCDILGATGKVLVMLESKFDAVTAVSGSGPAYVYMFIEAMALAGEKLGLSLSDARIMASETLIGASKMALASEKPLSELIDAVCSKGGTTIEAVKVFREKGLYDIVNDAMTACFDRSVELGKL